MKGYSRNKIIEKFEWQPATLYDYERYWPEELGFPFIFPSQNSKVEGEAYFNIDKETIAIIDQIEGEGELYHRIKVTIELSEHKDLIEAWTFVAGEKLTARFA